MPTPLMLASVCHATLALACVTGPAPQPSATFVGAGLRITVSSLGPEHPQAVRVKLTPRDAASDDHDTADDAAAKPIFAGNCRVSFDSATHAMRLSHSDGAQQWVARFRRLDSFGRAHVPGLEIAWQAAKNEALYGLGERFDSLNVAGRRVQMWIVDEPGQGDGSASYFVTPVLFSSAGYGLFADDNPEGVFDLNAAGDGWNRYQRAGPSASFVISFAGDVPTLVKDRTAMIGGLEPAPSWAYSPWISRNSYENQAEAEAAIDGMQSRNLPFGVIVLEAWKGRSEDGEFNRFSRERWPHLNAFLNRCKRDNIRIVLWQVPILYPASPWFKQAKANGYLVRDPAGNVSLRTGWMAGFGHIDFFNPDAAAFWKDMLRPVVRLGVSGFKADDGESIKPTDRLGDGVPGWQAHNAFSAAYNRATYELFKEEGVDGMLWARSGSLGIESSPGLWAGDQGAEWDHLQRLVTAGLSTALSGMPYWGHDIGGYYGRCTPELYMRWLQLGALSPLMQFHGVEPREPWNFGNQAVHAYRLLANLRMNLRPALIELGQTAAKTGLPIMRPMFFATGEQAEPGHVDQYMLGEDMLVAPVTEQGATGRVVRFPPGRWLHALSPMAFDGPGEFSVPIDLVDAPLFIREGATLPVALAEGKRLGQWSAGDATVRMSVTPQRLWGDVPVLSNVQAPLRGNPLGRKVALHFAADERDVGHLRVRWWFDDAPDATFDAPIAIAPDEACEADLTPPDFKHAFGRRQQYAIVDTSSSEQATMLRGSIDWKDLIQITLDDPYRDVVTSGATKLAGHVTNCSAAQCSVKVNLVLPDYVSASSAPQTIQLDPGQSAALNWSLDVAPAGIKVGDSRIAVEARVGGAAVDRAEAALIRSPRWVLAGPFPADSKSQGFAATTAAEWEFGPEARFPTTAGPVRWEALDPEAVARMNGMDFNEIYGQTTNAFVYATAVIRSDRDQPVQLRVGTDDTLSLWVNGQMLIAKEYDRPALPDQDIIDATFKKGENRVLIKVAQGQGGWALLARITGPNGTPIDGLTDALDATAYRSDRP